MPTNAIARRKPSSSNPSARRKSRRGRSNPAEQNPEWMSTAVLMSASALAGATTVYLVGRMGNKMRGAYNGFKWTITPVTGSLGVPQFNWNLSSGGTDIAGGASATIGAALGDIGQAIDASA